MAHTGVSPFNGSGSNLPTAVDLGGGEWVPKNPRTPGHYVLAKIRKFYQGFSANFGRGLFSALLKQ